MNSDSKYFDDYYSFVLDKIEPECKYLKAAFKIVYDLTDRRGIKQEFNKIDGDIQDEIIDKWLLILKETL